MTTYEPFLSLGLAAAAGLLIGLERERSAPTEPKEASFLGGARTHPLFALVGGVSVLAARQVGAWAVVLPLAGLIALLVANYWGDVVGNRSRGITSEAAFLLSFMLGALSLTDGVIEPLSRKVFVVSAVAVVATALLSSKPAIHPLARRISSADLAGTLKFLVVAVIVVPLLPDETFGPLQVLNPRDVGLFVVLISGISFVGYAGIRLLGPERGLGLTGVVGGLVSSTAVTLSLAGRSREREELCESAALAVILASTIMFLRVIVIVAVVNPSLVRQVAPAMLASTGAGVAASLLLWIRSRRVRRPAGDIAFANPFELGRALGFALLFAVVLVGSKAAAIYVGDAGTYAAGLLAGTTDVDAITLSMAGLAGSSVDVAVATTTIFLGAAANTLVKGVLAATLGGWRFGRYVLSGQLLMLCAGILAIVARHVL
ncbi:MAG TPA: MgtC/SapB family protein [Anaeromyxobacteraceae bacterium]|nr:MgtC/SapB family protein [Anaeromyxobacteraceae bacterium]